MQKAITKYGLAAHLAILAVAPFFLPPPAVLYLAGLAVIWIVIEPSRVGGEMLHDARRRVWRRLFRDPIFWVFFALVLVSAIVYANSGIALVYDAETTKWSVSKPKLDFLPGSVEGTGYPFFAGVLAIWVVVTGVRLALGRSARLAFLLLASFLSGVGATVLITQGVLGGAATKVFDYTLDNPAFLGSVFGIHLSFAIIALFAVFEHRWFRALPFAALSVTANALGLFAFAPPLVHLFYIGAAALVFFYAFIYARLTFPSRGEFKYVVVLGLSLALAVMLAMQVLPPKLVSVRVAPYTTGEFLTKSLRELRLTLDALSLQIWKTTPWFGTGLGSYAMELGFHATARQWEIIPPTQLAPLNGYWLLLVERGTVGAFLMGMSTLLLVGDYLRRFVCGFLTRTLPHPAVWLGPLALGAAIGEALFSTTPMTNGLLIMLAAAMAVSTNAFPKVKKEK